jgi:hypothetical protein
MYVYIHLYKHVYMYIYMIIYTYIHTYRNEGVDGINTAIGNNNLGEFHLKSGYEHLKDSQTRNEQLRLAKPYYKEAIRIFTKLDLQVQKLSNVHTT